MGITAGPGRVFYVGRLMPQFHFCKKEEKKVFSLLGLKSHKPKTDVSNLQVAWLIDPSG
jgi:hypothetical protein